MNVDVLSALSTHQDNDILVLKKDKTIQIRKTKSGENECVVVTEIDVENNMKERYDKYLFGIESDCYVPKFDDIKIQEGAHPETKLPKNSSEYVMKIHKIYDPETQIEKEIALVECDFYIPLNIDSGHNKTLKVTYPTKAFQKIFNYQKEETSMKVTSKTLKLNFNVVIDNNLRKRYEFTEKLNINKDGEHISFLVMDASKRRMVTYEQELRSTNCHPKFGKHEIKWSIPHPVQGYTYTLFFSLTAAQRTSRTRNSKRIPQRTNQ